MRNPIYKALVIAPAALIVFYLSMIGGFNVALGWTNPSTTPPTESLTPLPITDGGTGASSAASARADLGAAASGANSDITSLSPSGNLIISPTGYVAIGTSTATQELTVAGTIYTTGGIKFPDGTSQTTAASGVPSGLIILSNSTSAPSGYTYTGSSILQNSIGSWSIESAMPDAASYTTSATVNGIVYVFDVNGSTKYTQAYNPSTNSWTVEASSPYVLAQDAVALNGKIYILSDYAGAVYTPSTNSWSSVAAMPSTGSNGNGLMAAAANGMIYVFGGGYLCGSSVCYLSANEMYNPSTNVWTSEASMPTARMWGTAQAVNGVIYVVGGYNGSYPSGLGTVEAYNPSTNSWTEESGMPTARSGLSSAVVNGILYTIGGYTNASALTASVANEAYNPSTNSWTEESGMPTANGYGSAASVNAVVYFTGGFTSSTANEAFTTPSLYYLLSKN